MSAATEEDAVAPREPEVGEDELLVVDDVEWQVADDGTEFFVLDGARFELGEDGFAYEVGPADSASDQETTASGREESASGRVASAPGGEENASDRTDAPPRSAAAAPELDGGRDGGGDVPDGATRALPTTRPGTAIPGVTRSRRPAASRDLGPARGDALLRLSGLRSGYGSLPVLHQVDLEIAVGETAVLLGLNGAGKTTTALNICGALKTWEGHIEFDGQDATGWNTKRCVDAGIVMVPEGRRVFPELSVDRNLQVGAWRHRKDPDWVASQRDQVLAYFPRLGERKDQLAGTLSGGEQQMLAIARGLMARPTLLIVDEASMGLAPVIVKDVFDIVRQINADGVTVLLIEQNVGALDVADLGVVMEQGRIVRTLRGDQLLDRSAVSEALMG
jgi:branched-chain amino acid transport system ATP-binding protein